MSRTMHSSDQVGANTNATTDHRQTNLGETLTLSGMIDTLSELIKKLPKSPPPDKTIANTSGDSNPEEGKRTWIWALHGKETSKPRKQDSIGTNDDSSSTYNLHEKLRKNLSQIKESLAQLQSFQESELAKQLQSHLQELKAILQNPSETKLHDISKEIMKLKYQIPSLRKPSLTSSSSQSQTSSNSNARSGIHEFIKLDKSASFLCTSFFKEIQCIYEDLEEMESFFLKCFAVLTENAVVNRRLLTYLGLGEGIFEKIGSTNKGEKAPEEIVDEILWEFQLKGLIEPAIEKQKEEVKSYKMDPLVRSAVSVLSLQEPKFFDYVSNGNVEANGSQSNRAFLVKGEETLEKTDQNLDQENLVTLFNLNEDNPDLSLVQLAKKTKNDDVNAADWLSKMKKVRVLYLGRWQRDDAYHIEVKSPEFLDGLKSMQELKFLSLQGISKINKLPRSIGKLRNLVILDLKDCNNLEALPEEIISLENLRYMDISNCYLLRNMPKGLSSLKELQVLKGFIIGGPQSENLATLKDLKGLKKLMKLTIIATSKCFPTDEDFGTLHELQALRKLTIAWGVEGKKATMLEDILSVSECLKLGLFQKADKQKTNEDSDDIHLTQLVKLDLQCFPMSTAKWLTPKQFPNLEKLYIRGGSLATLDKGDWTVKTLRLKFLTEIKMTWSELKKLFPKLDFLEKVKCPRISFCPCDEDGVWVKP